MKHITPPVAVGTADSLRSYFGLAQTPSDALPISFPAGQSWISIDPGLSSPHVIVGITGISSRPLVLAPGRVLPIDPSCTSLGVFNAAHAALGPREFLDGAGNIYAHLLGRVVLVVGTAAELPAWIASLKRITPSPKLSGLSLHTGRIVDGAGSGTEAFAISNLTGLRVSVNPLDAAGNVIAAPPDFGAVLRPEYVTIGNPRSTYTPGMGLDGDPLDRATNSPITPGHHPNADQDVTFSDQKRVQDFEIAIPAPAMRWQVVSMAGAGVISLCILNEGRY